MMRSFSCGGAVSNEGASTVGRSYLTHLLAPDAGGWLLALMAVAKSYFLNVTTKQH
jgi:hypothetical protein